jgi:murein DD-endopeptidase MepM/ murein hydrolase activator NlpD
MSTTSSEAGSDAGSSGPRPRGRRPLALGITALLAFGAFVAVPGSTPVLSAATRSSDSAVEMPYDRDPASALQAKVSEDLRSRLAAYYAAVANNDALARAADSQRASRGEPRQSLGGAVGGNQYWRPTTGTLTQPFHPGHKGIDIGVPEGTPVVAATDAAVTFAGQQSGYGNHIEVRHPDGVITTYSHLSRIDVAVGEPVKSGQQIAASGNTGHSTGPHLHFEVRPSDGAFTDPIAWLTAHGAW